MIRKASVEALNLRGPPREQEESHNSKSQDAKATLEKNQRQEPTKPDKQVEEECVVEEQAFAKKKCTSEDKCVALE